MKRLYRRNAKPSPAYVHNLHWRYLLNVNASNLTDLIGIDAQFSASQQHWAQASFSRIFFFSPSLFTYRFMPIHYQFDTTRYDCIANQSAFWRLWILIVVIDGIIIALAHKSIVKHSSLFVIVCFDFISNLIICKLASDTMWSSQSSKCIIEWRQ